MQLERPYSAEWRGADKSSCLGASLHETGLPRKGGKVRPHQARKSQRNEFGPAGCLTSRRRSRHRDRSGHVHEH